MPKRPVRELRGSYECPAGWSLVGASTIEHREERQDSDAQERAANDEGNDDGQTVLRKCGYEDEESNEEED